MSSRSRRARPRQPAAKATPGVSYSADQVTAMLAAQQAQLQAGAMSANPLPSNPQWDTAPFGPGRRLPPAPINVVRPDTGRAEPRLWEFPVSWNLQINDQWHVPWRVLQRAADMPLFRKCIESRKSICKNDFVVTVDPKAVQREVQLTGAAKTDVEAGLRDKYLPEIARITDWLQVPDRQNDMEWSDWCSLLMENRLKYDAAVVYPRRTYGGDLYGLEIIDGKTIKPLLDERGARPLPPYPAFQQIMYGFPRGEFTATADPADVDPVTGQPLIRGGYSADTLYYKKSIYRSESPYGMSDTEIALFDGLIWMRRMGWILSEYTEGVMPTGMLETSEEAGWNPTQWEEWQRLLNDHLSGNTGERHKWPLLPPGTKLVQGEEVAEKYQPDYDMFLITLIAGDYGLPPSEIGFTQTGALGASFHEGEEDILYRKTRLPDAQWLSGYATKLAIRELGMPSALRVQILGLEWEDEAASDALWAGRVASGRATLNEERANRGDPPYAFAEADMAMLQTGRGVVFLDGSSKLGAPGTLIGPPQASPGGMPGQPGQPGQDAQAGQQPDQQDDADEEDDEDEQDQGAAKGVPTAAELRAWGLSKAAVAEAQAYRRWLAKGDRRRPFAFQALDCGDALAHVITEADIEAGRVTFPLLKDADAGPKARLPIGRGGSGTWP